VGYERPQGIAVRQDVGAGARQALDVGFLAALEQSLEVTLHRTKPKLQLVSRQQTVLEAVPVLEDQRSAFEQLASDRAGFTIALREGDELAK
jgi:hypothetical protein